MAEPNLPTSEYIRLKRDTEWLLDADHGRSNVPPYTQAVRSPTSLSSVHKQPWRFHPTKSKTFDEIQNAKGVERAMAERLLLNEIQQRHQDALDGKPQRRRRRKPRTLQPMPIRAHQQARMRQSSIFPAQNHSPQLIQGQYMPYNSMYQQEISPSASSGAIIQHAGSLPNNNTTAFTGGERSPVYDNPYTFFQMKDQNEVVVSAMAKQLKKYKVECRRLRKQKRATLYVLRLLEQKILELSGSNATAEKIDPTAPGYEMHPEVYRILKDGRTAMRGCRGIQTGSDEVDIVEDYALERSAHELGLKLVREDRKKQLRQEENVEDEERAERLREEREAKEKAKENGLSLETKAMDIAVDGTSTNEEKNISEGASENTQQLKESTQEAGSRSNSEMALSLADKAREEQLIKRRKKFREIFERLDTDMSGYLDRQELRKAVYMGDKELGAYVRPATFKSAFSSMDYNENGQIPYPAFEAFCMDCEDSQTEANAPRTKVLAPEKPLLGQESRENWTDERLQEIFDRLDSNKNGSLERIEILRASHSDPDLSTFILPKRVNSSFAEMSRKDDDGRLLPILFDDFKKFCRRASSRKLQVVAANTENLARFRKIFDRLDSNGNGTLERMELYKASHMDREMASFVSPKQFKEAFSRMDVLSTGHITFDAFAGFCMDVESGSVA